MYANVLRRSRRTPCPRRRRVPDSRAAFGRSGPRRRTPYAALAALVLGAALPPCLAAQRADPPAASPATVELEPGDVAEVSLTGRDLADFTEARVVPEDPRGAADALDAALGPLQRDGARTLALRAVRDARPGRYGVELTGSRLSVLLELVVTVLPPPDRSPPRVLAVEAPDLALVGRRFIAEVTAEDDRELAAIESELAGERRTHATETQARARVRVELDAPASPGTYRLAVVAVDAAGNRSDAWNGDVEVVEPPELDVRLSPAAVVGGEDVRAAVVLREPAPLPLTATIETQGPADDVDPLAIRQGTRVAEFTLATHPVEAPAEVTVAAAILDRGATAAVEVRPPPPVLVDLGTPLAQQTSWVTGPQPNREGVVTLDRAAPPGGVEVDLSTDRVDIVSLPAGVSVPPGETRGHFRYDVGAVTSATTARIRAALGDAEVERNLEVRPTELPLPVAVALPFAGGEILGGLPFQATVTLDRPAPAGGILLHVSTSSALLRAEGGTPQQVPGGVETVVLGMDSEPVDAPETVELRVQTEASPWASITQDVTLLPLPGELERLSLSHEVLLSGAQASGFVTFSQAAPVERTVALAHTSMPGSVGLPAAVTVAAYEREAGFQLTAPVLEPGAGTRELEVTASHGGRTVSAEVEIHPPPAVAHFDIQPRTPLFGEPFEARVELVDPAPPGGVSLPVSWSPSELVPLAPPQLAVPEGGTEAVATLSVQAFGTEPRSVTATVTAPGSGGESVGIVAYPPPVLEGLSRDGFGSVPGGSPVVLTLTLAAGAPPGGAEVPLSTDRPDLLPDLPPAVTVPHGLSTQQVVLYPEDPGPGPNQRARVTAALGETERTLDILVAPAEAYLDRWELTPSSEQPLYPGRSVGVSYGIRGAGDGALPEVLITPSEAGVLEGQAGPLDGPTVVLPSTAQGTFTWQVADYGAPGTLEIQGEAGGERHTVQVQLVKSEFDAVEFLPGSGLGDDPIEEVEAGRSFRVHFRFVHPVAYLNQFTDTVELETDRPDLLQLPSEHVVVFSSSNPRNVLHVQGAEVGSVEAPTPVRVTARYHGAVREGTIVLVP